MTRERKHWGIEMRKPISAKLRYQILERDRFTCQCCGGSAPNVTLHVDHILAVANGGSNDPENLRAICITCNVGKGAMEPNIEALPPAQNYPIRISDVEVANHGDPLTEPIFWIGKQWAVTGYGVECRDGTYFIEAKRLWQDEPDWGWKKHMAEKDWVDLADFSAALDWARQHYAHLRKRA
jgi:hypothetical protein